LKPAPRGTLGKELAALAGGTGRLLERSMALLAAGDARLAAHLVDWAADAEPSSREVHAARAAVYRALMDGASSTMSRGIYGAAARQSEAKSQ
jgi:alkyl sulfatase BDS1-like metallo-beta-lactamase superfamily hydrolase